MMHHNLRDRPIPASTRELRAQRARQRSLSKRTPHERAADVTQQRLRERDEMLKGRG
jgi:hypothetical protein